MFCVRCCSACSRRLRAAEARPYPSVRHEPVATVEPAPIATSTPTPAPAPIVECDDAGRRQGIAVGARVPSARRFRPGYDEALAQGKALAAQGDALGARDHVRRAAAKLDRKAAAPHIELARLFITSDDRALAMAAATKVIKLAPDFEPGVEHAWSRAARARGSYDDAITAFAKATDARRGEHVGVE